MYYLIGGVCCLLKIKKQDFDSLPISELSQRCFEPLISLYKSKIAVETNSSILGFKEGFYEQLSEGQKALFMFYVYYNHARKSHIECYWWSAYFMAQPKSWSAIKAGMKHFKDDSMIQLLENIEQKLKQHDYPQTLENFAVTREELNRNKDLEASFKSLYTLLEITSPITIRKINDYINRNPREFFEIEDQCFTVSQKDCYGKALCLSIPSRR
ncbi:hypothetical protein KHA93_15605 [Bacillus sp. FJAT-49732]|uniref:Uncharacterized protein n=1 Tax=Lederbergia citrisecunda TaxID=2833583 RepID=A0A942YM40_9BACI|nr:hypothetical protein [Lederbergia citrisecunda]MBS4201064.1 hypothetical protein [Lederbergia citrisecunda]